jgi:hypothetical protein
MLAPTPRRRRNVREWLFALVLVFLIVAVLLVLAENAWPRF